MSQHKQHTSQRFGATANAYVSSDIHAKGQDLDQIIDAVTPQPTWHMLDVATGGGHTAARFAQHVQHVTAVDLTAPMLHAARRAHPAQNITLVAGDAEHLPFATHHFDAVVNRFAAHHFVDCFRFVMACYRVLKPGGIVAIVDQLNPDDQRAAHYIDAFDRLRDPSHGRAYADYEWRGMLLDAGFTIETVTHIQTPAGTLQAWAERQQRPPQVIEKLHLMLARAPQAVQDFLKPRFVGTPHADFDHQFILITGRKPAQ
jgi:ubiquinone/menaquinone biosynthesis C-methylase UbiE